jgi:hypothetical protein
MFRYYRSAGVCYAYLADVPPSTHPDFEKRFPKARWFTRGWTLQELLAPRDVWFFAQDWSLIGVKADMVDQISEITGIERGFLRGAELGLASVAKRLSWASERVTTRIEDQAYCLLGIFDVFMPMLYGEGRHAFRRLQDEIMRRTNDQSMLAWGYTSPSRRTDFPAYGFFARTPWAFSQSRNIVPYPEWPCTTPWVATSKGIRMEAPVIEASGIVDSTDILMAIGCHLEDNDRDILALCLLNVGGDVYKRGFKTPLLVPRDVWMKKKTTIQTLFIIPSNLENRLGWDENKHSVDIAIIFRFCPLSRREYSISKTEPAGFWDEKSSRLRLKQCGSDSRGDRSWNVVLHLADEQGNEQYCIRVETRSMDKFNFCIEPMIEELDYVSMDMDDQTRSHICKVGDETFDLQGKFKNIWCGEIITIVNLDLWSDAQLKDGTIRKIREAAEEIRHTGLMGQSLGGGRMMLSRTATAGSFKLLRNSTGRSLFEQPRRSNTEKTSVEPSKPRSWRFWKWKLLRVNKRNTKYQPH